MPRSPAKNPGPPRRRDAHSPVPNRLPSRPRGTSRPVPTEIRDPMDMIRQFLGRGLGRASAPKKMSCSTVTRGSGQRRDRAAPHRVLFIIFPFPRLSNTFTQRGHTDTQQGVHALPLCFPLSPSPRARKKRRAVGSEGGTRAHALGVCVPCGTPLPPPPRLSKERRGSKQDKKSAHTSDTATSAPQRRERRCATRTHRRPQSAVMFFFQKGQRKKRGHAEGKAGGAGGGGPLFTPPRAPPPPIRPPFFGVGRSSAPQRRRAAAQGRPHPALF